MKIFAPIYDFCLRLARHRHAPAWLTGISAAESVVFPIPPDVMLAPMTLGQPKKWWRFAALCTLGSLAGGLIGYALGHYALEMIWPWMEHLGWDDTFEKIQALFRQYGFLFVFVAAFTPIPYKVFTITSGATGVGAVPFILGSLIGRGARFFLVAGLVAWGGEKLEAVIRRYIEWLGWAVAIAVIIAVVWLQLRGH